MDNEIKEYCKYCRFYGVLGCKSTLICNDGNRFFNPMKRGRWIYKGTVNSWDEMACSCCDGAFSTQDREQILDWEFCPHCGAKMDGDETIKG